VNTENKPLVKYEKRERIDLIKDYLPNIEKIEGLDVKQYIEKMKNRSIPDEVEDKNEDVSKTRHTLFASDRFSINKSYKMNKEITKDNLAKFIKDANNDKIPLHFNSHPLKKKVSIKIVGDDFEEVVYKSNKDFVIFFEPHQKNLVSELREIYEDICDADVSGAIFGRYNTINESPAFKYEGSTPSIGIFLKKSKDKPIYLDLSKVEKECKDKEEIMDKINGFIQENITS